MQKEWARRRDEASVETEERRLIERKKEKKRKGRGARLSSDVYEALSY
jgi:hypothetical protein